MVVEHAPPPELAPFVDVFWTSAGGASNPTRILPDGCVDVLVDRAAAGGPRAFVVGAMTRPLVLEDAFAHDFVAVRFRPGGAHALFDAPLSEWNDGQVELATVWSDVPRLLDAVGRGGDARARVRALADDLIGRFARAGGRASAATRAVALARALRAAGPETSVAALSARLGCTRQHLTRTLAAATGLGAKTLQRIARMQRARALLEGGAPLVQVALDSGYVDQPHFNGEWKALTGCTPAAWRSGRDDAR
jgi:AraC-like DNA-binding protein